jgi:hypothetical protein
MRRRMIRAIAGTAYLIGGLEVGLGAVLMLSADPRLNPRMLLIAGGCFLIAAVVLDRLAPAGGRR